MLSDQSSRKLLEQWFSTKGNFASPRPGGHSSADIFGYHNWYVCWGAIGIYLVEANDAAKHPTITGYSPRRKNYLV